MNILGLTQGANIDIFLNLLEGMRGAGAEIGRTGALVSHARHFLTSQTVSRLSCDVTFLKEWEVVAQASGAPLELDRLRRRERDLSAGAVWSAIIADRRLIYGRQSKFTQDYRVHFSDTQLWSIAQVFIDRFDALITELEPDVVVGFTPVTFGEHLALEIAYSRGIPCLQLHSSRVRNYFAFHDTLRGTSRHFVDLMNKGSLPPEVTQIAKEVVEEGRKSGIIYEGVNLRIRKGRTFHPFQAVRSLPGALWHELARRRNPVMANDHHDPGHLAPWFYQHIHQPLRALRVGSFLERSPRVIREEALEDLGSYCFFPMHSEPEVALQVLGRPYHKNQIELLRNLGASLPPGTRLVVKEHPRSYGLRPVAYYEQLFEIPNLYMVGMGAPSTAIVRHAELVAVISGTIGFEAAMMGIPVLVLGHPKYAALPGTMLKACYNLFELSSAIDDLLENYRFDEDELIRFVSALVAGSVGIDVYSVLLRKPGRYSAGRENTPEEKKRIQDYEKLTEYALLRIAEVTA